jgi:hypothetical protein
MWKKGKLSPQKKGGGHVLKRKELERCEKGENVDIQNMEPEKCSLSIPLSNDNLNL